ncbi:MAG: RNA polymerase subunit sigma-70 [Proteobacteria bacterium]|uniref:ECF-type sigma factor n=1 Tax=Rudaea sp. TaxID=2136325 RepID=UPI00321FC0BA|nr:RNA polymerase subunit sigma-70 [Pseudomonadota bacterium]
MDSETSVPNPHIAGDLFPIVYEELRRIARSQRRGAGGAATLDTTALVHEVYLKFAASDTVRGMDRVHFLSLAARAMRQILVDHARSHSRLKRGGDCVITGLSAEIGTADQIVDLVALDAALSDLAEVDPRAGCIVEWRIFSGLEIAEIARLQNLAERTVFRDWRRARAFLIRRLGLVDAAT